MSSIHPPLLQENVALNVSRLATTTRLTIRCLSLISEAVLETTKFSTSTTLDLGRKVMILALQSAKYLNIVNTEIEHDGKTASSMRALQGLVEHYTNLGIYVIHHAFTLAELLSVTSLQLATKTVKFSFQLAEDTVRLFDGLFGSTETSRAVAAIVQILKREIYSEADDIFGQSKVALLGGITKSVVAYACLQTKTKARKMRALQLESLEACTIPMSQVRVHNLWDEQGILDDEHGPKSNDRMHPDSNQSVLDDMLYEENVASKDHRRRASRADPSPDSPPNIRIEDLQQLAATAAYAAKHARRESANHELLDAEGRKLTTTASVTRRSGSRVSEMVMRFEETTSPTSTSMSSENALSPDTRSGHSLKRTGSRWDRAQKSLKRTSSTLSIKFTRQESIPGSMPDDMMSPDMDMSAASLPKPNAMSVYPRGPIVTAIARYIRFANGAYGKGFMRILGIGKEHPYIDGDPYHHSHHYSFAHHAGIDVTSVIFSSFQRTFVLQKKDSMEKSVSVQFQDKHGTRETKRTMTTVATTTKATPVDIDGRNTTAHRVGTSSSLSSSSIGNDIPRPPKLVGHLSPSSLLHKFSFNTPSIHPLVHYLCVDHETESIVLTLRGTLGLSDVLVDLTCDNTSVDFYAPPPGALHFSEDVDDRRKRKFRVHDGMFRSARLLQQEILVAVRLALESYAGYGLVLCGHSLGGGVAAVLTLLWSDLMNDDPRIFNDYDKVEVVDGVQVHRTSQTCSLPPGRKLHCYVYGPPCTVDPELSRHLQGAVTSIVHRDDIVPTLSLGLIQDLKTLTRTMTEEGNKGIAESVIARTLGLDRLFGTQSTTPGLGNTSKNMPPRPHSTGFMSDNTTHDAFGAPELLEEEEDYFYSVVTTLSAEMSADKLAVPGRVYWILTSEFTCVEDSAKLQPGTRSASAVSRILGWLGLGGYQLPEDQKTIETPPIGPNRELPAPAASPESYKPPLPSRKNTVGTPPMVNGFVADPVEEDDDDNLAIDQVDLTSLETLSERGKDGKLNGWIGRIVDTVKPTRFVPKLLLGSSTRPIVEDVEEDSDQPFPLPDPPSRATASATPLHNIHQSNGYRKHLPATASWAPNPTENKYLKVSLHRINDPTAVFGEVRFSKTMLSDHSPKYYEDALLALQAAGSDGSSDSGGRRTEREWKWEYKY